MNEYQRRRQRDNRARDWWKDEVIDDPADPRLPPPVQEPLSSSRLRRWRPFHVREHR